MDRALGIGWGLGVRGEGDSRGPYHQLPVNYRNRLFGNTNAVTGAPSDSSPSTILDPKGQAPRPGVPWLCLSRPASLASPASPAGGLG